MSKSSFANWFREQSLQNPVPTEYVAPAVQASVPEEPVFSVDVDVIGCEAHLLKNGERVEPKDLTDQEKLAVIEMMLADTASEANHRWEESMGDNL